MKYDFAIKIEDIMEILAAVFVILFGIGAIACVFAIVVMLWKTALH